MGKIMSPLSRAEIKRIFRKFEGFYGAAYMANKWGTSPEQLENAFEIWADELRHFNGHSEAITHALYNLPPGQPPDLGQFKLLCNSGLSREPNRELMPHELTEEERAANRVRVHELMSTLKSKII